LTFGASAAPSTTPSLFGTAAPTATTAPPYGTTTNTGFFGAKPAATTTGGLFGGAAKPAFGAPTTGGLFGSQPTNTLGGGFNTNTTSEQDRDLMIWRFLIKSEQEAQNATVDLLSSAEGSRPHNLWQALGNFQKKWDFKSPDCAFRYYFYNVVPAKDVHLYQKPADHDPRAWEEAQKANPDPTT
jgi:nuclear pore complex protein Nup54